MPVRRTGRDLIGLRDGIETMDRQLENLNVLAHELLATPEQIKAELPTNPAVQTSVADARRAVHDIIRGTDHRLLLVVGPF